MKRNLLQVIQAVTPSDTYFVIAGNSYIGILSFWLVALVQNIDETESWFGEFPIVADGNQTMFEQIQDDGWMVVHWSEMYQRISDTDFYSPAELDSVIMLLDKLRGA